ncbi:MAG: hypothetical protein V1660_03190 [archaeon]
MTLYKEAAEAKKEALQFYKHSPEYRKEYAKKINAYKIGSDKKVDKALIDLYNEIHTYGSGVPLRIRKEEGISKLEMLLKK